MGTITHYVFRHAPRNLGLALRNRVNGPLCLKEIMLSPGENENIKGSEEPKKALAGD